MKKATPAPLYLPFDFYARHREGLELDDNQARELHRIADGMQEEAQKLEASRVEHTNTLKKALEKRPVDVDVAMHAFQKVLDAENGLKALQFRGSIEMRNALRDEQLRQVKVLALEESRAQGKDARTVMAERIQLLKSEIKKRLGSRPSPEIIAQLQEIEQAAMDSRFGEAKELLEKMLRQLRGEPEPGPPVEKKPAPDKKQEP